MRSLPFNDPRVPSRVNIGQGADTMAKKAKKPAKKVVKKVAKKAKKAGKRTTMHSSKGAKLYVVRDAGGQFKDIQTFKRAHGQDIKRESADGT